MTPGASVWGICDNSITLPGTPWRGCDAPPPGVRLSAASRAIRIVVTCFVRRATGYRMLPRTLKGLVFPENTDEIST
jgi:hypothetical protein